jgi:hypothetical protein
MTGREAAGKGMGRSHAHRAGRLYGMSMGAEEGMRPDR